MVFIKTPKQREATRLISKNFTTLLEGGSRSGKTLVNLRAILVRALRYPGTKHLIAMFRFADVKRAIWYESMPDIDRLMELGGYFVPNKADWYYKGDNGSQIWIGGLDDKERADKILGQEYATIYFPEASRTPFGSYEIARTRCNPPRLMIDGQKVNVPGKILIDQNPPTTAHWTFKLFHERKLPDGTPVAKDDFARLLMNPLDNVENLSPEYIEKNLKTLSAAKRKRFLDGQYGTEEGSLWKRDWLKYRKGNLNDMTRIVVGVDPSGSKDGAEAGIIIAGTDSRDFYVFDDFSIHGTPKEWGDHTIRGYERYRGDCIVAEKNYGGEMVESTITDMGRRQLKVKLVTASRGKILRAEPISAMYERGLVYHDHEFPELEDELCTYTGEKGEASPNRLDALVWALTELSSGKLSIADVL
ncbi:MAG: DNA-packaging protein [Desulfobacteraceae bacterium]|nr:DNA-packaging protein [Desulfobacteraceae bacterium]